MATKREQEPSRPDRPLQIPEVEPKVPDSESHLTDQAATVQPTPIPRAGATSTPSGATPLTKPPLRPIAGAFDPTQPQKIRQDQLDEVIVFYPPAAAKLSALGTRLLGQCAIANGLGTHEPVKVFLGYSDDRTQYSIMPVGPKATKGVEVTYVDGLASLSFRQVFAETGKVVEEGYREYYPVWKTDIPIEAHETTGWAIYFSIEQRKRERIQSREETAEAAAPKTKKGSKSAKASTETTGSAKATEAAGSAKAAEAEGFAKATEAGGAAKTPVAEVPTGTGPSPAPDLVDELDDPDWVINEQQQTISELEQKLKEYQKKFGKL